MSENDEVDDIDVETLLQSHGLVLGEILQQQSIVTATPIIPTLVVEGLEDIKEENNEDQAEDEGQVNVDELLRIFGLFSDQESGTISMNMTEDINGNENQDEEEDDIDVDEDLVVDESIDVDELLAKYGFFSKKEDPLQSSIIISTPKDESKEKNAYDVDVAELLEKFDKLAINEAWPFQSSQSPDDGESGREGLIEWMDEETANEILARYGEEDSRSEDISTPTSPMSVNKAIIEVAPSEHPTDLLSPVVPDNVFKRVFLCKLIGADSSSYVYIKIRNKEEDRRFYQQFSYMNLIYSKLDKDVEFVQNNRITDVSEGQILVAKIHGSQPPNSKKVKTLFIRVRIVAVLKGQNIKVVDIDEQQLYKVKYNNLYPMLKQFYSLPMRIMKCSLYKAEELLGTAIVAAVVALSCQRIDGYFVRIVDIDQETKIPSIILYHSEMELAESNGHWTYRDDIMRVVSEWNKPPYTLMNGMLLTHIRATNVTRHGKIWIQFQSAIMDALDDLKPKNRIESQTEIVWKEFQNGETRFVKKMDGKLRRVELMGNDQLPRLKRGSPEEAGDVLVEYIDFGVVESADFRDLYSFSTFAEIFQNIPPQGFEAEVKPPVRGYQLKEDAILEIKNELGLHAFIDEPGPIPVVTLYFPRKGVPYGSLSVSKPFSPSLLAKERSKEPYVICRVPVTEERLLERSKEHHFDFAEIMDEDDVRRLKADFYMHKTYLQYERIFN